RDAGIQLACLDLPVSADCLRHCGIERQRPERQCLVAISHALLRVALMDVHCARPPQANHLDAEIPERLAVFEGAAAIFQARLPLAERKRRRMQVPYGAASPPEITESLEAGEGALAGFDRFAKSAGD